MIGFFDLRQDVTKSVMVTSDGSVSRRRLLLIISVIIVPALILQSPDRDGNCNVNSRCFSLIPSDKKMRSGVRGVSWRGLETGGGAV